MRKSDYKGFSFADRFESYEENPVLVSKDPDYVKSEASQKENLLRLIYSIDERTNCPSGDLTFYVNPKANPEIKKFILDNLLMDVSAAARPAAPDGLSDDDILALSRNSNESVAAYAERLNKEIQNTKWLNDAYKKAITKSSDVVDD